MEPASLRLVRSGGVSGRQATPELVHGDFAPSDAGCGSGRSAYGRVRPPVDQARDDATWGSPRLSERERERLAERQGKAPELVVISPVHERDRLETSDEEMRKCFWACPSSEQRAA